jgi:hypothetical protein
MFNHLQLPPLLNALAVVLGIICLLGSLYLTWVTHHVNNLKASERPKMYRRVQDIRRLAQEYGNAWYLLMGLTWPMPVINRLRGHNWWPSVYNHAEWVFKVAKGYRERENR